MPGSTAWFERGYTVLVRVLLLSRLLTVENYTSLVRSSLQSIGVQLPVLTDAELVLGLSRHLSAYAMGPERAALGELEFAGWSFDVAFRLRGSTTIPAARMQVIGLDVGLTARSLKEVVGTLEALGWLSVDRDGQGSPISVSETLPSAGELISAAPRLFDVVGLGDVERAALTLLRATTMQPLLVEDALAVARTGGDSDADAEEALRHLTAMGLVRRVRTDSEREVVFNPNVWTQGDGIAQTVLRAADAGATAEIGALLQELAASPGLPEAHVSSVEPKWVKFAITQGLIQRSVIQTSDGSEQGFLFTPHLARDPFGGTAGDASGHVRQLVGSMIYATTFAQNRLIWPDVFLRALINRGVAGNVSSIGTDYPMLEKAGIVRVVPTTGSRYQMELLQSDVAEDALRLLTARSETTSGTADAAALRAQRTYVHVERDRARLALSADTDEVEQARLMAALRDVSIRRTMNGSL
jgi:hypothetical protein